jgi:hypothetical protein
MCDQMVQRSVLSTVNKSDATNSASEVVIASRRARKVGLNDAVPSQTTCEYLPPQECILRTLFSRSRRGSRCLAPRLTTPFSNSMIDCRFTTFEFQITRASHFKMLICNTNAHVLPYGSVPSSLWEPLLRYDCKNCNESSGRKVSRLLYRRGATAIASCAR